MGEHKRDKAGLESQAPIKLQDLLISIPRELYELGRNVFDEIQARDTQGKVTDSFSVWCAQVLCGSFMDIHKFLGAEKEQHQQVALATHVPKEMDEAAVRLQALKGGKV